MIKKEEGQVEAMTVPDRGSGLSVNETPPRHEEQWGEPVSRRVRHSGSPTSYLHDLKQGSWPLSFFLSVKQGQCLYLPYMVVGGSGKIIVIIT